MMRLKGGANRIGIVKTELIGLVQTVFWHVCEGHGGGYVVVFVKVMVLGLVRLVLCYDRDEKRLKGSRGLVL